MGNNNSKASKSPGSPPRYEDVVHGANLLKKGLTNTGCQCHRLYPILKLAIEKLAAESTKRTPTNYQEWEQGRIRTFMGVIASSKNYNCDGGCICHDEYALLAREIRFLIARMQSDHNIFTKQKREGRRSEASILSWERHKGDIKYLNAMLRECKGK